MCPSCFMCTSRSFVSNLQVISVLWNLMCGFHEFSFVSREWHCCCLLNVCPPYCGVTWSSLFVPPMFMKSFICSQKMWKQPGVLQKGGGLPLLQECLWGQNHVWRSAGARASSGSTYHDVSCYRNTFKLFISWNLFCFGFKLFVIWFRISCGI